MVSVLHKEWKKGGKAQVQDVRGYATEDKKNPNFQLVNKPSWISPHEVLQSRLINTVYDLLVKNNKGEGMGAQNTGKRKGLINFLPPKRRWRWGGGGGAC